MSDKPLYAYISTADFQWNVSDFPMDSAATIDALFEWMAAVYDVKRVYWRGEQDRIAFANYELRRENPWYYNIWSWIRHLNETVGTNDLAMAAARRHGIEMYLIEGLFERAAQGDTGGLGSFPYPNEDRMRIEHPQWIPVDRWGESLAPGPIEFCYPDARKALVDRLVHHVVDYGYDGIVFYTYVENTGIHYFEEFGFNEPIVDEFRRRHGVDIRTQPFDKEAWAHLRGEYVTQFLRELHTALAAHGRKVSVSISGEGPNLPKTGMGGHIPGAGMVFLDWETWAREGVVDELFGFFWDPENRQLMNRLLNACKNRPVELVARGDHTAAAWAPYIREGVRVAHGAWYPGMKRFTFEAVGRGDLDSPDWRRRAQVLLEIADGRLTADGGIVARLCSDPHVLVRREAVRTLVAIKATDHVCAIEAALLDDETAVHFAATDALTNMKGPSSHLRLLEALEKHSLAKSREACVIALQTMPQQAEAALIAGVNAASYAVREVSVRALEKCSSAERDFALLSALRQDPDYRVRFWAARSLAKPAGLREPEVVRGLLAALDDSEPTVQLGAARSLGDLAPSTADQGRSEALSALQVLFRQYGDSCERSDAAWGWRVVGNAIVAFGTPGTEWLETMRVQRDDRWLAWAAYQVVHVPQATEGFAFCEEEEAVETHRRLAPPFPGRRR